MSLESYLIDHCSPTLARLKSANLFRLRFERRAELEAQLARWNRLLAPKGVSVMLLLAKKSEALVYVCRPDLLQKDLEKPGVQRFLRGYGYTSMRAEDTLNHLRERLRESERFPHEIGIFLGYPLGDVIGFIANAGQNSKCTGCWKVYCNECEAVKAFARFQKCRDVYARLWRQGRSVWQLTVAA